MTCVECGSSKLRLSRYRWSDLARLAQLLYPVRCRDCRHRTFVTVPRAFALFHTQRSKRLVGRPDHR
jgi:DNA-directed RNA polymerase subunit RPC12/RpoP